MQLRDGISQNALARKSGVPQPTINRILKGGGAKGPETTTVRKLADALEVRFEWLMDGKGPMLHEGVGGTPGRPEGWSVLTRVDEYELRVLDLVRHMDERGRRDAEASLEEIAKVSREFAAESERQQGTPKERAPYLGAVGSTVSRQRKS